MFKEDLYEINNEIDKINQRIDSLCNAVNTNIASLQTIIDVMQDNDYVDSIVPIVEGGETVGYEITFTQSGSVKIYHGKKGETGATGHTPVVSVKQAEDGRWYWTIDGEYLLDGDGDKILAEAIDGEDGATGADGITPQLKVEGDYWYISYDNKATWERLGKATGEAGKDGDSMFKSVNYNDDYVELVLVDGTVLRIPTWASHMLLVDEIAKINSNISALQAAVEALESNDYVQKVTPVKDNEGNIVGYTLQFVYAGDVTIYHGEDGKDGEDGEDGYTPKIGVRQHPDGIWYWTIDDEWLLDKDGNRVRTTGKDGVDGEDGADGANGSDGLTPELMIIDDYWYISYDNWATKTKLGKAKGEDGAAGSAGTAGDAFFKGVDTSDEYYVKFTLADGTVIKIPTWKAYQELADLVDQLNTNFKSLNDIVVGIQNNDYITGYTPIVDPQTNEEIGYTLHFKKSGDITIYHGKTGQDGVAPDISIQEHPKYGLCWTYNGEFIIDPGTGKPVALPSDGKNGKDGVSPKLKIEDGKWWVSYNNGSSWTSLGQATGDTGATGGTGDSFFKSIVPEYATDANGNVLKDTYGRPIVAYIVMTLAGDNNGEDVVYKVPTEYVTDDLNKRLAAIESQFSAISTIVNSLMNAEYIKDVIELTEGPAIVGYEIVFVKYTIGADGKLTETTRKSTIRNGGAGTAGTIVNAEYDEATDTWYWTLDGKPLVDADGNYVAINGKDGKPGATPQMRINTTTNFWEVSYDGGKTWVSTEVLATGPQGPQGNPGQGGAAGDSFFSNVYKSEDGLYWVFDRTEGEDIKVPSWKAFEDLQKGVSELEATVASFNAFLNGNQYIKSVTAIDGNRGWDIEVAYYNAETQQWENKHYNIYNGTNGDNGVTPEIPAITVEKDPADNNYYWKVGGVWLTDAEGNRVRANGTDGADGNNGDPGANGLTPEFRINAETGELEYMFPGDKEWISLGKVVGKDGEDGNDGNNGANGATNIVFASAVQFDENGAYVSYTKENDANKAAWVGIQYGTGSSDFIWVPTYKSFLDLLETLNAVEGRVEAIEEFVNLHKTSIEGIANLSGNVTQLMQDVATLKTLRFIGTPVQTETGWEIPVYDGTGAEIIGEKITLTNGADGTIVTMVEGQDGEMYWKIGDTVTEYRVTGNDGKTPAFQINDITGQLEYKFPDTDWIPLGDVVGSDGTNGSNGATNIILASEVQFNEEGAYVSYSKVTDASQANWVGIIFSEGDNADSNTDDQIIWVPTYKHFEALAARVTVVEGKVQEIEEVVALHTSSLEGLSALSGNVTQLMQDVATLKTYKFIGTPVETENGWEIPVINGAGEATGETITLNHGADGTDVTIVQPEGSDDYYWFVDGKNTGHKVTGNNGKDGKTPIFRINAETGKLEYQFEGDQDWTVLDKVVGEDGAPGAPGTNGATNVVFASAVEFDEDGAYVSYTAATSADAALWVGVQYGTGETDYIWMPTYKNFQGLAAQVTAIEGRVTALEATVALHETSINSLVTLSTDVNGLIEDVAKLKTYKFIGTPVETENGWEIPVINGVGEATGETITLNHGADGTDVTIVQPEGSDDYYWFVNGKNTGHKVTGNNGKDGKTPIFRINAETGKLEYHFDGDEDWIELEKVVGEPGTPGTPGANGATNVVFASEVNEDGTFTEVENASQANWVGIIFVEGENADSYDDDQIIWVPTYKNFQGLQALVTTLNTNVTSLSGLINGKRFITAINENWSGEINGVQRTGVEITYVEISDNKASEPKTMYIYNGLAGVDGANGATVGVKAWTAEDGEEGEVGKLYWTITLNNQTDWLRNGEDLVPAVGTDGTPGVPGEPGTNGKTPEFKIEDGVLYWKYTTEETWTSLGNIKGDKGDQGDPGTPGEPGTPGADALSNVADNGTYYTITYSDGTVVNVQKWVSASNVTIEFFNVSLSDLGNATTPVTELSISEEKTILYRVNGSASGTTMPTVMATSEGGYVISCSQPTNLSTLGSVGQITITPTYAFATGAKNGRVIVFIDYYGTTIMKELILKGSANVEIHETITVEASQGSVEIDLAGLGLNARPALGFSYSYDDYVDRTGQSDNFVYADKVGTSTDKWISRGTGASAYDNTTKKETLTIGANPTNKWRAGMVVVYPSKNSQAEIAHIKIIQKPGETNLANPDNSGEDDPANCYIISEPGRYLIPTYKGTNNSQTYDFSTIDTPISDGTGVTISKLERVVKADGKHYISFDVNMSQTAGSTEVVNNNSMIVVKDGNNVVWSWHLWFASGVEDSDYGILGDETYQQTNATMLNRNLGANSAREVGLYYKWGDKDPYFTATGSESGAYHGDTSTDSWATTNGSKALTDPCPPGYRVPSNSVWLSEDAWKNTTAGKETLTHSSFFHYDINPNIMYPYSGYIDDKGDPQLSIPSNPETQYMAQVNLPHEQNPYGMTPTYGDYSKGDNPQRFLNINYKVYDTEVVGYSGTSGTEMLKYGYENKGFEIVDCTYQKGTWIKSGSGLRTKYNASYDGSNLLINEYLTGEAFKNKYPKVYDDLVKRIQVIKAGNVLNDFINSISVSVSYNPKEAVNTSYGYPIRCVKIN